MPMRALRVDCWVCGVIDVLPRITTEQNTTLVAKVSWVHTWKYHLNNIMSSISQSLVLDIFSH